MLISDYLLPTLYLKFNGPTSREGRERWEKEMKGEGKKGIKSEGKRGGTKFNATG